MVLMKKEATRVCKERLRKRVLTVRMGLDRSQAEVSGQAILEQVLGLEAYRRAKLVHTYVSSKENEVDTRALICTCLKHGKRVAVPVVMPGTKTLAHALIDGLDQLVVGPWGLAQPDPAVATWLPADVRIDLVVVPGIAFDRRGHRIGWGGGYYDRFLAQVQAVKIGLCYDELVLDCIPGEPHDVPVDLVIAETAIHQGESA
ncbi:MAG: 5-formyltetrahydrofolate cyclo-ligase [Gemmatimonadetes bacterium]|nr:5-formyltetrahydrofolate cyclo-ligase [Gemmatimonadota bacterium]